MENIISVFFVVFQAKDQFRSHFRWGEKKKTISVLLHNCNQQGNLRGGLERRVCNPVTDCIPKRDIFFSYSATIWICRSTLEASGIQLCFEMHTKRHIKRLCVNIGCSHLGEELGLWGMLEPPCAVCMPWQLSVTNRHMIAVFPEPALPTMTAPRPSQLLVFLRTSSRRVKSQSLPMNGVSAVMPGTSNSSGFSIMSACLNGTNLPGGSERKE